MSLIARERQINQVIIVDRKKYAVGLFWQLVGVGFVAHNYARKIARTVDKKLNLFTEYRSMIALGSKSLGHRSGMASAAAEVVDALTEYNSFLGVFSADKYFYLIAVRNGIVLQDKLFENEEEARVEYSKLSEIPDWNALFAPESWSMPRAIERNLSDLITNSVHAVLRPIGYFRSGVMSILLLFIFIIGLLIFFRGPIKQMLNVQPKKINANPQLAAEYKKQIEEKNRKLDEQFEIKKLPEPQPIVLPYDHLPNVEERAQLCYRAIGFVMQPIPGWVQISAECSENYATAKLKRTFGTLGDFYRVATDLMPAALVTEDSEDSLTVRATLPKLQTGASLEEKDVNTVLRDVSTIFQAINTPIDAKIFVKTLTNGTETVNLNIVEIAAKSKLVPMEFMQIFDGFAGVYMTQCGWNASQRVWNYEVTIYAK